MKPPTKPPDAVRPPPSSNRGIDEPSSGRLRKDVNYVPVPSAPLRAKPPLPSASTRDPASAYEDDLVEDMATPTRTPNLAPAPPPPEWPLPTGPIQPIAPVVAPIAPVAPVAPIAPPPSSQRHYAPPPSLGPLPVPPAASSARVRQITPMDAPPYSSPYPSQQGPTSQQQITGPQLPIPMHPSGSYPAAGSHPGSQAPVSRGVAEPDDGMPLGYVVASAFFLAIALVGFGLYLAFEVISL